MGRSIFGSFSFVLWCFLVFLLGFQGVYSGKIDQLPGLSTPINFTQYSGYIEVNQQEGRFLHYWFAESQRDPSHDPVVLWLNGGPGCSSLDGLLTENGPFFIRNDLTVGINPYSWNRVANVIWLEAPAGVGFSYSKTGNYVTNDDQTAADNYQFLLHFFEEFSQFKNNKFFVAGESYAGHYVPQLARNIVRGNAAGNARINLVGTLSGNPSTDDFLDANSYVPFLANHALTSMDDYEDANTKCKGNFVSHKSKECEDAISAIFESMGKRINPYNIYAKCEGQGAPSPGYCFTQQRSRFLGEQIGSQTVVPCMNVTLQQLYLNRHDVRQALFVPEDINNVKQWTICSQVLKYTDNYSTMIPIYNELIENNVSVLIYSGDVDSCVNYLGTEMSVKKINAPGPKSKWQPWIVEDQIAGYKKQLGEKLQYITVKDAGHMVPLYRPPEAFAFFSRFIDGHSI